MGKRGFQPKPTALRVFEGNPSGRPLPRHEPKITPVEDLTPPEFLSPSQVKIWESLSKELCRIGLLSNIDFYAFLRYVTYTNEFIEASKSITMQNLFIVKKNPEGKTEFVRYNPMLQIRDRASLQMKGIEMAIGITPSARSRIISELMLAKSNEDKKHEDPYGMEE